MRSSEGTCRKRMGFIKVYTFQGESPTSEFFWGINLEVGAPVIEHAHL